jgi:hypothetical protein
MTRQDIILFEVKRADWNYRYNGQNQRNPLQLCYTNNVSIHPLVLQHIFTVYPVKAAGATNLETMTLSPFTLEHDGN